MPEIYQPAEDSLLLSEVLKKFILKNKPQKILDMGSGSGIQAETLINSKIPLENITLVDINPKSIRHLKSKFPQSKIIHSNLFSKINKNEKFDLIIFNPPYLPENKYDKKQDTTGGKNGSEIINEFLKQSKTYLNQNGKIFLLTSNLTKRINWLDYKKKPLAKKKLFFEELYVWEVFN